MNMRSIRNQATGRCYQINGPVYETPAVWCGTGTDPQYGDIFVKLLHYGHLPQEKQRQTLQWARDEANTMIRAAKCTDKVPKLYDHWDDRRQKMYVLVMQKMPGMTLRQWMRKKPLTQYDEKTVWLRSIILRQLAEILRDIHAQIPGISHRDLKPENVMIWLDADHKWQVGLIDFGTAALNYSVNAGTYGYQAPEQMTLSGTIMGSGAAKDVFSLGILWYELLTGKSGEDLAAEFVPSYDQPDWEERPALPTQVTATRTGRNHQRLFEKMTSFDPGKRPTLEQVVQNIPLGRK